MNVNVLLIMKGILQILRCPLFGCPFYTRFHQTFEEHCEIVHFCGGCRSYVARKDLHFCEQSQQLSGGNINQDRLMDESYFREESRSHHGTVRSYIHYFGDEIIKKVTTAFERATTDIEKLLTELHRQLQSMLLTFAMQILMERDEKDEDGIIFVRQETFYFHSSNTEVFSEGEFSNVIMSVASEINNNVEEFIRNGSGWKIHHIESLQIRSAELRLFQKSRAKGYLPMPFSNKTGYINFHNKDSDCFKYVVCAGVYMNEVSQEEDFKSSHVAKFFS